MISLAKKLISEGTSNVFNLGSFIFGISGIIICLVVIIAPYKILEVMPLGYVKLFGYNLEKNGALGILLVSGVVIAAITQPLAGLISDKTKVKIGKRLPFILIGGFGTSLTIITIYYAKDFISLLFCWMIIQFFANLGEGPANALLKDHVSEEEFGSASGKFNSLRVIGSVVTLIIVLQIMNIYDQTGNRVWFLAGLLFLSCLIITTTTWSYYALRYPGISILKDDSIDKKSKNRLGNLILVLITFSFTLLAFTSLQSYAVFLLQDILNLENPAPMLTGVIIVLGLSIGLSMFPAGKLSDKYNRKIIIIGGGIIGSLSCFAIIIFHSPISVLILCSGIGISVGSMFGTIWALTNDVISRKIAGNQIGLLALGFLFSGIGARLAGILIDYLNNLRLNLGYFSLIAFAGICFIIAPLAASMIKNEE